MGKTPIHEKKLSTIKNGRRSIVDATTKKRPALICLTRAFDSLQFCCASRNEGGTSDPATHLDSPYS
jgi:hypothetical protein